MQRTIEAPKDYTHALVAPGQGNQEVGMGLKIAQAFPKAQEVWSTADRFVNTHTGSPLSEVAWRGPLEILTLTENAQPALIADALARKAALVETGKLDRPGWHAGNSLGFVVALVNSGSLSIEGAVNLGKGRGEAFKHAVDNSPKTTMVALTGVDPEIVEEVRRKYGLEVCLINTPSQTVLGGEVPAVQKAASFLKDKGLGANASILTVDAAFHSRFMEPAVPLYERVVSDIDILPPTEGKIVAGATVTTLETAASIRRELVLQLTHTERWGDVMQFLRDQGVTTMTELNEKPKLTPMARREFFGIIQKITHDGMVLGLRWTAPEAVTIAGGSDGVSRDEISEWYRNWVSERTGMSIEELNEEMHFVDDATLDSADLMALRAEVRNRFGRNVPDEEAKTNVTIGSAVDATFKLLNS